MRPGRRTESPGRLVGRDRDDYGNRRDGGSGQGRGNPGEPGPPRREPDEAALDRWPGAGCELVLGYLVIEGFAQGSGRIQIVSHDKPPLPWSGRVTTGSSSANKGRSCCRARAVWLFTVPTEIPSACAVCASDKSR